MLRGVVAVCVVVSGVVHWQLWRAGERAIDVVGPAFLVNAVAGVVIGVLLLVWRTWVPLFLAFGFGLVTLAAFVVATTPLTDNETWTAMQPGELIAFQHGTPVRSA